MTARKNSYSIWNICEWFSPNLPFGAGPVTPRGFRFAGCNFSKPSDSRLSRRGSVCDSSLCVGPWSENKHVHEILLFHNR